MKKVKLDILGLSSSVDSQTGSFALVLKENKGERRLPIIIGMFEAQSIAMEIEKIIPNTIIILLKICFYFHAKYSKRVVRLKDGLISSDKKK